MTAPHVAFVESNLAGLAAPAAARRAGCRVSLLYEPTATWLRHPAGRAALAAADRALPLADPYDPGALLAAVRALDAEEPLAALITVLEYCVEPVAAAAAALGLPGTPPSVMATARHKGQTRRRLEEAGLPS
ncbi:MAG TPA: biotin carboxylase, partial [Thermoanaerobaculia bacterium]|nr:biotin carboxylase [Thermoanaerobaculia bacterium]